MNDFQDIYEKYYYEIFRFINKLVNYNKSVSEELTQETFYQIFISLHRFKGKSDIKTWMCQIAKNVCFKYFRKNPISVSFDSEDINNKVINIVEKTPEELVLCKELNEIILKGIINMNDKYRDVLVYRLYESMPFKKIAAIMNISENSAKVIFYRGKEMLKKSLTKML
ncbi:MULTISPECIES: sigma-70 family RNA polymerase sigma factor [Clostridium]|uniref:Sigma-70 family RNA polymerase sigma factor n=1 Tax=Clostridium cibarium TaxID=2762247 RepID=A0ABR8PXH7_9CLOT|nr:MULTISPECIES: sigma-70 family RNA polymerase sigma factor [Clostridium]MBD7912881.1 sigma-70 family RNA polymerase sigma factor [Clostridium cibarium]